VARPERSRAAGLDRPTPPGADQSPVIPRSHSSFAGAGVRDAGIHAGQVVTVHVANQTITIDLDDKDSRTVRRTTAQPVRSIKAAQSRKDSRVSRGALAGRCRPRLLCGRIA
jgi:hypothetical protein